jgi:transcriptional regulator with XRE-family HTH domain
MAKQSIGERVYEIRSALGPDARHEMSQKAFAELVNATAKRAKIKIATFVDSTITRIEKGERRLQVEEIELIASMDPLKRGKTWLAFGEAGGAEPLDPPSKQKKA